MSGGRAAPTSGQLWINTLGLACASVSLARQRLCVYLCLVLVSEAHSLLNHSEGLSLLAGVRVRGLRTLNLLSMLFFRLVAHMVLSYLVLTEQALFPHAAVWVLALGGLALVILHNVRLASHLLLDGHPAQHHAPRHT